MREPTEEQIKAVSTAPRITPDAIEANIASTWYINAGSGVVPDDYQPPVPVEHPLRLLTFCVLVLKNGFTVVGKSACASAENFDAEVGMKIARADAINQCWPLMGYALKERLFQSTLMKSAAVPEHWNADGSPRPGNPLLRPGANIHGIGPDTDGGPNPHFKG